VAVSWVVPAEEPADPAGSGPYVLVDTVAGVRCGELVMSDRQAVQLRTDQGKKWRRIPAGQVRSVTPVDGC